jgi:hypothetical protein
MSSAGVQSVDMEVTLWCAGLPYAEDRRLTDAECDDIRRHITRLDRYCRLFLASIVPTLALCLFAGPALLGERFRSIRVDEADSSTVFMTILTFSSVSVAIELYLAFRAAKHKWALAADLETGIVSIYRGILAERNRLEPTQMGLLTTHLLRLDPHEKQTIELLKTSRVVWRVNGIATRRTIQPTLTEVATTPPFAAIAAQWLEPVSRHETSILYGGKRELSDTEKRELQRFVRRLVTRPATSSLPVAFLSILLAVNLYRSHPIDRDPMFWIFLTGGLCNVMLYLFQIRYARRFGDDLRVGYVGIRRIGPSDPVAMSDAPAEPDIEFLPVTGMLWTKSGEPAVWRRGST